MFKKLVVAALLLTLVFLIGISPPVRGLLAGLRPILIKSDQPPTFISANKSSPTTPKLNLEIYTDGLQKPRDLEFTSAGTLLVSIPTQSKVIALWGVNKEGRADHNQDILIGLNKPHGLAMLNDRLFVAEETAVNRYIWNENKKTATFEKKLFDLPSGGRHVTRSLAIDQNNQLFVSIGSTCDVCQEKDSWLTSIIISDTDGKNPRVFASGLRNSVFIAVNPETNQLWGTEMGRDLLGDDIPPDEINIIEEGKNYGWPYCYGQRVFDQKNNLGGSAEQCVDTEPPYFEIQAHSAPLGLAFVPVTDPWQTWGGDLLVAYHGSWNRSQPVGYKVVRLDRDKDKIINEEILFDFLDGSTSSGRPVDIIFDNEGNFYISDDGKGVVYRASVK